ncbi:tubulin epsilon and delta complex protein 1 isoform X1 [Myotis daubentonii]|uniref:tubulin epsilon and delta complex protein 1 isoform X1 n=1 Tax=Myotis daubentonii TaxID=98922 RepID=UPI0028736508|nr:tubulin epsilon and delta complex protein 1 isoform X1 [Myotis daubentonii]
MGRRRRRADLADAAGALPEAIAALSRSLPAGPSPEIFRRAKFDRPEAAPALWRLLFRVLSLLRADRASASRAPEAQARWVKAALRAQGYPRLGLARLPEDGSQGSRELLLALAWLLAREPLPERLLAQTRVRLGDEMPVCECGALASPGQPAPRVDAAGPVDVRHLQWLMGKLRFRWRNLMASQQEQCALLGKIHAYTRGCHGDRSLGHLSVAETELLRDPEGGRQVRAGACGGRDLFLSAKIAILPVCGGPLPPLGHPGAGMQTRSCCLVMGTPERPALWFALQLLQRLESENARLEAVLEWRRRELVFWQWMDTVLGACPPEASQPTFPPGLRGRGRRAGAWGPVAWELQALQEELQAAVGARRAAWAARVGGQGPEWSAARQAAQEAVGQELAALRQAWARGGGGGRAQPHGPHRLVRTEAGGPGGPGLRAAEVIGALRSREACLEETLRQLQEQCRQQLARLAGALPGLIWIPPPRR